LANIEHISLQENRSRILSSLAEGAARAAVRKEQSHIAIGPSFSVETGRHITFRETRFFKQMLNDL